MFKKSREKKGRRKRFSLSYKLILIMLLISLIPLAISALLNISSSSGALEESNFNQLSAIKTIKANQIEDFFSERFGDINVLSNTPIIKESLLSKGEPTYVPLLPIIFSVAVVPDLSSKGQ